MRSAKVLSTAHSMLRWRKPTYLRPILLQLVVFFSSARPGHVLHWLEDLLNLLQKLFVDVGSTLFHVDSCFHILSHLDIKSAISFLNIILATITHTRKAALQLHQTAYHVHWAHANQSGNNVPVLRAYCNASCAILLPCALHTSVAWAHAACEHKTLSNTHGTITAGGELSTK
jgi:hypothetical protein